MNKTMLLLFAWCIFLASCVVIAHDALPVATCENETNYMVPYKDGDILDPAGDGDCWTYDDHIMWHELTYNESEYSDLHLKESQYQCLESGCTNFFYGHVDLQLLEKCATHKCRVLHVRIEQARNCSSQLLISSALYSHILGFKKYYDNIVLSNRSNIEYEKHDMLYDARTVLDESYELVNDFNLIVGDLTTMLSIKVPTAEIRTLVQLRQEMEDSEAVTHSIRDHIHNMDSSAATTKWLLHYLQAVTDYAVSYSNALKVVKEHIDMLRDKILHQYVYGTGTCDPIELLYEHIAMDCVLCDRGTCNFLQDKLSCDCEVGWKGLTCAQPKDNCDDDPCINGGLCDNEFNFFRCECPSDWTGQFCEIPINQTLGCAAIEDAHPCQHNSNCTQGDGGYECECEFGWTGKNCQYTLKDCEVQNPCDRGECKFENYRIECECPRDIVYRQPFWKGDACSYEQLECDYDTEKYHEGVLLYGEPCSGHGLCTLDRAAEDGMNPWTCVCDNGYFGKKCEILLDPENFCVYYGVLCLHGNCAKCTNAEDCTCACDAGWTGMACSEEIDECETDPCQNGAPCVDQLADFYCECSKIPGQYGGKFCESQVTCVQSPCGNDEQNFCNDQSTNYISNIQCLCSQHWLGDRCEKESETCQPDTCFNSGQCMQGITAFCKCLPGWSGDRCQNPPTWCSNNPCGSTGKCLLDTDGYICECEPGWEGANCNINIDDCISKPCQNRATCIDEINDFTCLCEPGWDGKHCGRLITPCDDVSCPKHGKCVDTRADNWTSNSFECLCASNTCRALTSSGGRHDGKTHKVSRTYTVYGILVGMGISVLFGIVFLIWKQCHGHGTPDECHEYKMRGKRKMYTPTQLFETI